MAKTQLENAIVQILKQGQHEELKAKAISEPDPSFFGRLAEQRHSQRSCLFIVSMFWLSFSIICLFSLIGINAYIKILRGTDFSLFGQYEMEVLSVSVFGQLVGIVAIIAKSLWDEGPLSELLKKNYEETHKSP